MKTNALEAPARRKAGSHWRINARVLLVVGLLALVVGFCRPEWPYSNPPPSLRVEDLVGTWQEHYLAYGTDILVLRADGTFQQTYKDGSYVYQTLPHPWTVERFADGRVRLHLQGARYYAAGIAMGESDRSWFYDPIAGESVKMAGDLVLNVQISARGETALVHMVGSADEGWIILVLGLRAERFRRVGPP